MSNIIKGQRIRSESTLEIEGLVKSFSSKNKKKSSQTSDQTKLADSYYLNHQSKLKTEQETMIMLEQATVKAEQIIENAKIKADKDSSIVLEQAKQAGYTEGYEKGQLEAQDLIDEGNKIVEKAIIEKETMLKQMEPEIVEIIINITQKLISEEINFNKETIHVLIRKAIKDVPYEMSEITIKVPVDQYDDVLANKDVIIADYAQSSDVSILQDTDLSDGGCIIETPFGSIECNIMLGFNEIKKQMRLLCNKG